MAEETNDIIDQIFLEMYKESTERKFGYRLVIAGLMLKIMSLALRDRAGSATEEMQSLDKVSTNAIRVIEYVENNLADFDLDKMADSLYLNKYYLCHMFKKVTGLTVYKFLLTKRIESAKILLSSSDKPISQIAMELGFGSFSLFSSNLGKLRHDSRNLEKPPFRRNYQCIGDLPATVVPAVSKICLIVFVLFRFRPPFSNNRRLYSR